MKMESGTTSSPTRTPPTCSGRRQTPTGLLRNCSKRVECNIRSHIGNDDMIIDDESGRRAASKMMRYRQFGGRTAYIPGTKSTMERMYRENIIFRFPHRCNSVIMQESF